MRKTYLCINLNEFHRATIEFIAAANQDEANSLIHRLHPKKTWFVIDKAYADKHIVPADTIEAPEV